MAKIKVLGDMIQITSELTEEQFDKVKAFAPEALVMKDEDTGEEIFGIEKGAANISKYGICFCSTDSEGKLFMTTNNPTLGDHSNREEEMQEILDKFAPIIAKLNAGETHIMSIMSTLDNVEAAVKESIEFI